MARQQQDIDALAHRIAYSAARSDIETGAGCAEFSLTNPSWYDTTRCHAASWPFIDEAITYLEARGLIERDALRPHIVRVLDAPAEDAPLDLGPWPFAKAGIEVAA